MVPFYTYFDRNKHRGIRLRRATHLAIPPCLVLLLLEGHLHAQSSKHHDHQENEPGSPPAPMIAITMKKQSMGQAAGAEAWVREDGREMRGGGGMRGGQGHGPRGPEHGAWGKGHGAVGSWAWGRGMTGGWEPERGGRDSAAGGWGRVVGGRE